MDENLLDPKRARSKYETGVLENVRRFGTNVTIVGAAKEHGGPAVGLYGNAFAYTVGMHYSYSESDIIVIGLDFVLNGIRDFVAAGNKLHDGMFIRNFLRCNAFGQQRIRNRASTSSA